MENYIKDEDEKIYHSDKKILSRSDLANIGVCPAYFKYMLENEQPKTPALVIGSAFHKLVLEPNDFFAKYAVAVKIDRRSKEGKESYAKFLNDNSGKEIISDTDFETISLMRDQLELNETAKALLKGTTREKSIYYKNKDTDMEFKCRPDAYKVVDDKAVIIDLKTTGDASLSSIQSDIFKRNYDLQTYMYREGLSKALGIQENNITFVFIFIEKTPPYLMHIVCCDDTVYQSGQYKFLEYTNKYKECLAKNEWGTYNDGQVEDVSIPSYFLSKGE